jgi:tetratricopeptide (TPR) repeat protein
VDVDKASTAESDFIAIAKLLGHSVEGVPNALQVLANIKQSWLLILDNADDPDFDYQIYFPPGTHGAVLMTSRVPECKVYSPEQFEALEGLGNEDSKELLLKAANIPKESWRSYNDQAETVIQLLGSHTLALIQAGAYIAKGHCQLHEYPKVYKRQRKRLMEFRPKQAQPRYHDVYATFEASAEVLERSGSEAAKDALALLAILSMLDSAVLPLWIFQSAWDGSRKVLRKSCEETNEIDELSQKHVLRLPGFLVAEAAEWGGSVVEECEQSEDEEWDSSRLIEASSQLISLSLVTRHGVDSLEGLSMHPLAHAWVKDRQDSRQQGVSWIAAGCVLTLARENNKMWYTQERHILPHIQSYLDSNFGRVFLFENQSIIIPILLQCGRILLKMRQDTRLSSLLKDIFSRLSKNPEEPSEESLPLYILQARNLRHLGKHEKAIALLQKVVKIRELTLAKDDPNLLTSQHDLARAYEANGQIKEAIILFEYIIKIQEIILAEDDPNHLASQHELARVYLINRQVKKAVVLLEHIVKIQKTLAEDHPDRLSSEYELACAYLANGQIKKAVALLEYIVKIQEILAKDHPDRLSSEHELACAYLANGQIKKAVALLEYIVKIREILAEDHPDRLASQHELTRAYHANGQIEKAIGLLEYRVKIREILAEDHPERLALQHELAQVYSENGQIKEAITLFEHIIKIRETTLAEDDSDRLDSEYELAQIYSENGQIKEAITLFEHIVKIRETILAEDDSDRLGSQHELACAYNTNGQIKEAITLLENIVKIKEILAEDDSERLSSQYELARIYAINGQIKEAMKLIEHVVSIDRVKYEIGHPERELSEELLSYCLERAQS